MTTAELRRYVEAIVDAIREVDDNDSTMYYVRSFEIAESGTPVARVDWNGEYETYVL